MSTTTDRDIRVAGSRERTALAALIDARDDVTAAEAALGEAWARYTAVLDAQAGTGEPVTLVAEIGDTWWKAGRYLQTRGAGMDWRLLVDRLLRLPADQRDRYLTRHEEVTYTVNVDAVRADARGSVGVARRLRSALTAATIEGTPTLVRIAPTEATQADVHDAQEQAAAVSAA